MSWFGSITASNALVGNGVFHRLQLDNGIAVGFLVQNLRHTQC
jgi:hypothetical protein